jgi:uncharacterized protein YecT (DUF1311 family)
VRHFFLFAAALLFVTLAVDAVAAPDELSRTLPQCRVEPELTASDAVRAVLGQRSFEAADYVDFSRDGVCDLVVRIDTDAEGLSEYAFFAAAKGFYHEVAEPGVDHQRLRTRTLNWLAGPKRVLRQSDPEKTEEIGSGFMALNRYGAEQGDFHFGSPYFESDEWTAVIAVIAREQSSESQRLLKARDWSAVLALAKRYPAPPLLSDAANAALKMGDIQAARNWAERALNWPGVSPETAEILAKIAEREEGATTASWLREQAKSLAGADAIAAQKRLVQGYALRGRFSPAYEGRLADGSSWQVGFTMNGLVLHRGAEWQMLEEIADVALPSSETAPPWITDYELSIKIDRTRYESHFEERRPNSANVQTNDTDCAVARSAAYFELTCSTSYSGGVHPDYSNYISFFSLNERSFGKPVPAPLTCRGAEYDSKLLQASWDEMLTGCGIPSDKDKNKMSPEDLKAALHEGRELVCSEKYSDCPASCSFVSQNQVFSETGYLPRMMRGTDCDHGAVGTPLTNPKRWAQAQRSIVAAAMPQEQHPIEIAPNSVSAGPEQRYAAMLLQSEALAAADAGLNDMYQRALKKRGGVRSPGGRSLQSAQRDWLATRNAYIGSPGLSKPEELIHVIQRRTEDLQRDTGEEGH